MPSYFRHHHHHHNRPEYNIPGVLFSPLRKKITLPACLDSKIIDWKLFFCFLLDTLTELNDIDNNTMYYVRNEYHHREKISLAFADAFLYA